MGVLGVRLKVRVACRTLGVTLNPMSGRGNAAVGTKIILARSQPILAARICPLSRPRDLLGLIKTEYPRAEDLQAVF